MRALAVLLLLAIPAAARAQGAEAVTPVPRVTGTDLAALAKRLRMLEERVDNMWSVRQGPELLKLETVDRLASRLLAAEARLAALERGGAGGTQALAVATSLSLLAAFDFSVLPGGSLGMAPADLQRLRYLVSVCKLTPWPAELKPKARAMTDALHLTLRAVSRADRALAKRLAADVDAARNQLMAVGLGWTARAASPDPGHAHMDHSPRHGGQLAMRGDLHIEIVPTRTASGWTFDVHLSDATRTPLWPDAVTGDIVLGPDGDQPIVAPLSVAGEKLSASAAATTGAGALDLRVRLDGLSQGRVEMDFVFAN